MDKITLTAEPRQDKGSVAALRSAGTLPAVVYGHGIKNENVSVKLNEFEKALRTAGESTVVYLKLGQTERPVIIQDVQVDHVKGQPIHVDFYQVNLSEKLTANVELDFVGESPAVKSLGGTIVKVLSHVEVECLPGDLPHSLEVDISQLKVIEDVIHVSDLKVSPKVTVVTGADELIAKVQPPRDVEAELAEPVVEDVSKVEGAAEKQPEAAPGTEAEAKDQKPKETK